MALFSGASFVIMAAIIRAVTIMTVRPTLSLDLPRLFPYLTNLP